MCHSNHNFEPIRRRSRGDEELPRQQRKEKRRRWLEKRGVENDNSHPTPRVAIGRRLEGQVFKVLLQMQRDGELLHVVKTKALSPDDLAGTDFKLTALHPELGYIIIKMGVTCRLDSYHSDKNHYPDSIQLYFKWGIGTAPDRIRERITEAVAEFLARPVNNKQLRRLQTQPA